METIPYFQHQNRGFIRYYCDQWEIEISMQLWVYVYPSAPRSETPWPVAQPPCGYVQSRTKGEGNSLRVGLDTLQTCRLTPRIATPCHRETGIRVDESDVYVQRDS